MDDAKRKRYRLKHVLLGCALASCTLSALSVYGNEDRPFLAIREPGSEPAKPTRIAPAPAPEKNSSASLPNPMQANELTGRRQPTSALIREPSTATVAIGHPVASQQPVPPSLQAAVQKGQTVHDFPAASLASAAANQVANVPDVKVTLPMVPDSDSQTSATYSHLPNNFQLNWQNVQQDRQFERELAQEASRKTLARQVSTRTLSKLRTPSEQAPTPAVSTLTARRMAEQAIQSLDDAHLQLRRGMHLTAKRSAMETLRLIADANDMLDGQIRSARNLQQAQQALEEANDFSGQYGPVSQASLQRMVQSHQTPVLKDCTTSHLNGSRAADLYLDFARAKFAIVAEANPIATEALAVLAEVERKNKKPTALTDAVVISLLRAAIQARPDDAVIANELGFQLLKQGLLEEAQWALEKSFQIQPTRSAGVNLAETLRQSGNIQAARERIAQIEGLPIQPPATPQIITLSPQQFASLSPPTSPPGIQPQPTLAIPAASADRTASDSSGSTATSNEPTPAPQVVPAEPKSAVGRVAQAVSQLWK
ncbi:hypothetical protein FF011L_18870 [Roseimaritima multifibrata]|uniref:Tetratricopeptide repeat protein n=1 Tax=Roseimaritima multifibrata TaxID=1930274 RepID=A0A517ME17_9BACT|nr:hypothetical protein [Roseimaritima multifibrata]QDS93132.1 hypothetical protein FF011L_18870 [Roseimaritima multifibrata]